MRLLNVAPWLMLALLAAVVSVSDARAQDDVPAGAAATTPWTVQVLPMDPQAAPLGGVRFDSRSFPVQVATDGGGHSASACVTGTFDRPEWLLVYDDQPVSRAGSPSFEICVLPLTGRETEFRLRAIGPRGEAEDRWYLLVFDAWESFQDRQGIPRAKYSFLSAGLGVSIHNYKEGTTVNYSMTALTFKAAYTYSLPPSWELQANAFVTGPILSKSESTEMRVLGANLRFGYVLPWLRRPWKLSVLAGVFYSQSFVTANRFGYTGFVYPHLYPNLMYYFPSGDMVYAYAKYSALSRDFSPFSPEREIAGGVGWGKPISRQTRLTLSVDFSDMALNLGPRDAHSQVLVFSLGVMI